MTALTLRWAACHQTFLLGCLLSGWVGWKVWWPESVTAVGEHWFLLLCSLRWMGHEDPVGASLWHPVDHLSHVGDNWGMEAWHLFLIKIHFCWFLAGTSKLPLLLDFYLLIYLLFIHWYTVQPSLSASQVYNHSVPILISFPPLSMYVHVPLTNLCMDA